MTVCPSIVLEILAVFVGGRELLFGHAQPVELQTSSDFGEQAFIHELDGNDERHGLARGIAGDLLGRRDQGGGDRSRPAEKALDQGDAGGLSGVGIASRFGDADRTFWFVAGAAAEIVDGRCEFRDDGIEPARLDAVAAEHGVGQLVGAIGNKDEVVIEIVLQPEADAIVHPFAIELVADAPRRFLVGADAFQFAQELLAVSGDRARQQALFVIERDFVGAARGGDDGDHDAQDCDRDDHADRNDDAQPGAVPASLRAFVGETRIGFDHRDYP